MLSSKQTWQKDKVPVSVSSLQTLQILSSFRSMFTNCSSSSIVLWGEKQPVNESIPLLMTKLGHTVRKTDEKYLFDTIKEENIFCIVNAAV